MVKRQIRAVTTLERGGVTILVVVALLLGHAGRALADAVPLHIHIEYKATLLPDVACHGLHATSAGTASGTPAISGRWADAECIDLLAAPGSITVRDGTFAVTTSSGALFGTYHATAGLPDLHLMAHPVGQFTIVGGSGDFAGSTGSGTISAAVNMITENAVGDLVGTLTR